jgi:membrane protein DedA with SNARE-associated domain
MTFDTVMAFLKESPSLIPVALFVIALFEAIVFTSPLLPATVLFLGLAALQQAAGGSFIVIAVAVTVGTLIGDVVSYAVGRAYRDSIGGWWPFKSNPTWLPKSIAFMERWGALGLIGSKFLGPIRWFGPTVCGMLRMQPVPFFVASAVAAVMLALLLLAPPYYGMKTAL